MAYRVPVNRFLRKRYAIVSPLRIDNVRSLVIDDLNNQLPNDRLGVVHVYFDYRDQDHQSIEVTIASLLQQVVSLLPTVPRVVEILYQKFGKQKQNPAFHDLVQALLSSCREHGAIYIVVDALDECESECRAAFLHLLGELKECAKLLVTSRPYPNDIREALRCMPQVEIKAHAADLERYIGEQIRLSDMSHDIDDAFRKEIVRKIVQGAQEM